MEFSMLETVYFRRTKGLNNYMDYIQMIMQNLM